MQTNMLYDSSPPPRPAGLRNMMQPQVRACGLVSGLLRLVPWVRTGL